MVPSDIVIGTSFSVTIPLVAGRSYGVQRAACAPVGSSPSSSSDSVSASARRLDPMHLPTPRAARSCAYGTQMSVTQTLGSPVTRTGSSSGAGCSAGGGADAAVAAGDGAGEAG